MQARAFGKDLQPDPFIEGCELCMYESISIRIWHNAGHREFGKDLQPAPSIEGCELRMNESISIRTWHNAGPGVCNRLHHDSRLPIWK